MDLGSAWSENLISDQPYRLYTSRPVDQSGIDHSLRESCHPDLLIQKNSDQGTLAI